MTGIPYEIEDDSYYLFACAELEAREAEFTDQGRIERMIQASGMGEFLKVLGETVYAPEMDAITSGNSFEPVMVSGYQKAIVFLEERLRDEHKKLVSILFFEEFLNNMKLILKSLLMEKDLSSLHIPLKYDYNSLMEAYRHKKDNGIDSLFPGVMGHMRMLVEGAADMGPRKLELSLESFYTGAMLDTARSLGRKMMADYVKYRIDLLNIEAVFRHIHLKRSGSFAGYLHQGGLLGTKMLEDLEGESMDYITRELEKTVYADLIIKGAQGLFSGCSFASFERNRDLYFLDYFDSIKYSVSNLEKIFRFFLRKKIELKNINILYTGIRFDADRSNIRCKVD
jgi:vacuolar-type H+-ATPase subunit C/Vma6